MTSTPEPIDETTARELALAALAEITPAQTIGAPAGSTVREDGVLTLRFENRLAGYPGWYWTVSLARVEDAAPTVLEVELLPGDAALLAPEWVPWAERLADYHATQAALAAEGEEVDGVVVDGDDLDDDELDDDELDDDDLDADDDDDDDDLDDIDAADFDNDGSPILHSGDVDGVDIDELDEDAGLDDDDDSGLDDDDDSDDDPWDEDDDTTR
jgi:hypothetical protein